jgi:hypothetical protein
MKPKKVPYFDGKKLIYTYEYRGLSYSKEFKKMLKEYGLKVKKLIDNYFDKDIYQITVEDTYYIREVTFKYINNELTVVQGRIKKDTFKYKE